MAALRRISLQFSGHVAFSNPTISRISSSSSSVLPPALLISCRGFVSKLFVGGLSFYTSEKELSEAFSQYGQVVDAKIVMDRVSDRSKGFGFVTFASEDEAHKAISEMNGKQLNGRVIFVDHAKPKSGFDKIGMPIARGPPEPASEN
ncbi:small RNA-binding protein 11, chloroplastic isoform X1 [Malania oleifera]|uniref:small RNA-binding protein 11, chloroplastic isoform X1 n=1 Tax=Malania oleifera TaxID=397392 RepID=UPI0025AEB25F|nr:small RNA-binding protein 11, chloroplastic isoform X1 [Malania oleifera]